ncbi:helix-turn-helix domain-containing protein [Castellaniella sp.]|uniref:helix-turn-helix domain-containing protein n=1 Tax=Castellaniella sp. TaxID=1955812 RepID=UPI003C718E13
MTQLTAREHDCLYWASQGKTSWEMGRILGITERTANFHIANSCDKLGVRSRQAAITQALQRQLLDLDKFARTGPAEKSPRRPLPDYRPDKPDPAPPCLRRSAGPIPYVS